MEVALSLAACETRHDHTEKSHPHEEGRSRLRHAVHRERAEVGRHNAERGWDEGIAGATEEADFDVVAEPQNLFVGKVNEDFAIESLAGDIFQLGNHSWKIRRVEAGRIRVEDAGDQPPTIPFWLGEAPGRTLELSAAVADLRKELAERRHDRPAADAWLIAHCGVDGEAAAQGELTFALVEKPESMD